MGTLMRSGTVEATTAATPEQVWTVLADVTRIGEWSHECKVASWVDGATTAAVGARYTGSNRVGRTRWSRRNEILVADPARQLAWRTVPSALFSDSTTWRITLEPAGSGTRITQTFEVTKLNPVVERLIFAAMKAHRDRLAALREDMARLGAVALTAPATFPTAPVAGR
ncbi:MAG TPA: SRPBCC family protein [Ilumatobacteraceae bacterium]|nr:SRPBCC family protein [Ilumatobacteraceae bacterium]